MKCTILSVGTEILFGSIVNTNTVYLSQQLNMLGIDVMYHMTVGDNPARLKDMLAHAYVDCDLVITTGGLGPTQDDLTKEMIAEYFGERIVEDEASMAELKGWFAKTNRKMTDNNLKQAFFPEHATIIPNKNGTAPGFMLEKNGKIIISMPGPPKEMTAMFTDSVKPILEGFSDGKLCYKTLRILDIGESSLETELLDLIDNQTDPTLATYAKEHESTLRIASKRATAEEAMAAVSEMEKKVMDRIGEHVYSTEDEELPAVVLGRMMKDGVTLSAAESCTGGMFSKTVTDMPGVSAIFDRGIVTYSNEAKMTELGVKAETLEKFGAVSSETAIEMAEGLHRVTGSKLCISVTGIAGPESDGTDKPVGLVYIGLWFNGNVQSFQCRVRRRNRDAIRSGAVMEMFVIMYKTLFGLY